MHAQIEGENPALLSVISYYKSSEGIVIQFEMHTLGLEGS